MSIRFGSPPSEAIDSLYFGLARVETADPFESFNARLSRAVPAPSGVESFVLRRSSVEQGLGVEAAEKTGWRFRTAPGIVAELRTLGERDHRLAHVEAGPLASAFDAVIDQTVSITRLPLDDDYELRALFVPEFALMCAWLHGHNDFIVPLPGSFYCDVWTAYSPNEFVAVLREIAASRPRVGL
jgi:hypothetical protein